MPPLRKLFHHAVNLGATFTGVFGTLVCLPMLWFNLFGYPQGALTKPWEVTKYGTGSALSAAFFVAGYRRVFVKPKKKPDSAPPAAPAP